MFFIDDVFSRVSIVATQVLQISIFILVKWVCVRQHIYDTAFVIIFF